MVTNVTDENLLWKSMRQIKEETNAETFDKYICFAPDSVVTQNFKNLSKLLSINDVEEGILNLSDGDIQRGVEKFLYLNLCNNEETKRFWKKFYDSIMFYEDVFHTKYNRPVKEIMLSAIKPLKSFKSKDGEIIANKFILNLASKLHFQYLKSNVSDETKVEWTRNEQNVKGEH